MPVTPTSLKALILQNQSDPLRKPAHYDVRVVERPLPALRRGDVLVKITAAGFNHREVRSGIPCPGLDIIVGDVAINLAFAFFSSGFGKASTREL